MEIPQECPDCGATLMGVSCQDSFHQMLLWEFENPALGVVHHLMVLCYILQHPSSYSPEALEHAKNLLVDFLEHGVSPQETRKRHRGKLDSGKRKWKIRGSPVASGSYQRPIRWTVTAADVIGDGPGHYCDRVNAWAQSVLQALRTSGNLQ
jgi:hypothetical protein